MKKTHFLFATISVLGFLWPVIGNGELRKWNKKMQELSKTLQIMLPEIVSTTPLTPARQKNLEKNTNKLASLVHTVNMGANAKGTALAPEADPTLKFMSGLLEREVKLAKYAVKAGHTEYAKNVLRNVTTYCIACHTRHDGGPDFPALDLAPQTKGLTPLEKADLLAATRQFDAALENYTSVIGDKAFAESNPFQWAKAVRNALTIAIRVKRDPQLATEIMNRISSLPKLPTFYAHDIGAWKVSIENWKKEGALADTSEESLVREAERLIDSGKKNQDFPLDHSADISFLRGTAVTHELMSRYPQGQQMGEALRLAGDAYDLLEGGYFSPLPNMYYEACIRHVPHSKISEKCFRRYEQNVYFGWSGSRGTSIPDEIQKTMGDLEKLSKVATSGK